MIRNPFVVVKTKDKTDEIFPNMDSKIINVIYKYRLSGQNGILLSCDRLQSAIRSELGIRIRE